VPELTASDLARGCAVVLDLGRDLNATQLDALCLEAMLRSAAIEPVFFPWHPHSDVLTPLGALRPYSLLVPSERLEDAREIANCVLSSGDGDRRDVVVPIDDPWVLGYYIRIVIGHLYGRSREGGRRWRVVLWLLRAYVVLVVGGGVLGSLWGLASSIFTVLGRH